MIEKKVYSEALKREVVRCYFSSSDSMNNIAKKYRIQRYNVENWVKKYRAEFAQQVTVRQEITTFGVVTKTKPSMKEKKLTPEQMAQRIAELEQKLEHEKMHRITLDTMIDIAERDLNIAIRKKSGAKQSK